MTQRLPAGIVHACALALAALLLCAAGQPIFTDDLWWHLAYGRAFAEHGPRLAQDPLLYDAAGPPLLGSWLADVALDGVSRVAGWTGLRALHVVGVAAILSLAWSALRRAGASAVGASLGTGLFVALAAYRLVQLRPELASIVFCLLLYRGLIAPERPSWGAVAATGALAALWANTHAAFPLVLVLPGAALGGLVLARVLGMVDGVDERARRLAAALALAAVAGLASPSGPSAYLAYFAAGDQTPALEQVADEWVSMPLFSWPSLPQLPTPLAWVLVWALVLATAAAIARAFVLRPVRAEGRSADPALAGVALASLVLMLFAVRFLWLGVFPLLWLAGVASGRGDERRASPPLRRWLASGVALALVPAFVLLGDWPLISRGLPRTLSGYAKPYPVSKYYADALWLLRDSGARGHLYQDYYLGGFAGYWLAPELRSLANGTLNVPRGTLGALVAIAERSGQREGESFPALLDRLDVDWFLGVRLPAAGAPGRRGASTTAHLERTPGWTPVFRNVECALYLRANERNRDNFERLSRYYAALGVPFDREHGFEVEAVLASAPDWALAHGVVPRGFLLTALRARSGRDPRAADAAATVYAILGDYPHAIELDREQLGADPSALRARRRLVWSLLRSGDDAAARAMSEPLTAPDADGLSRAIGETAQAAGALDADARRAAVATLPLLSHAEAGWVLDHLARPPHRPPRD